MTKKEYADLLRTNEWREKRDKILKRDRFACKQCGTKKNLHIHHLWYPLGKNPWEIDDKYLQTLCEKCHEGEHNLNTLGSFFKHPVKKEVKRKTKKPKKNKQKINKRDKKIQERYNVLKKMGIIPTC
jgi:5-methylcytosine-specific restriction endonuclease McrA